MLIRSKDQSWIVLNLLKINQKEPTYKQTILVEKKAGGKNYVDKKNGFEGSKLVVGSGEQD